MSGVKRPFGTCGSLGTQVVRLQWELLGDSLSVVSNGAHRTLGLKVTRKLISWNEKKSISWRGRGQWRGCEQYKSLGRSETCKINLCWGEMEEPCKDWLSDSGASGTGNGSEYRLRV